jgi:hypothetical protein
LIEPFGFGEARVDEMKVYCKVDFLFVVDGRTVILDWKTGKKDTQKHTRQLLGYATWATHHLEVPADTVDAVVAYLRPSYEEFPLTPSADDLDAFADKSRAETEQMRAFCSDVEENRPLDKPSFPMTDRLQMCRMCSFKELCGRV